MGTALEPGGATRRPGLTVGIGEAALVALVLAVIVLLAVPLPQWMLDLLIGVNICLSLLVLSLALFLRRPIDFTAFPTVLLIATLYRLALNVASTRLILLEADAGRIIGAFGGLIVGGDLLVGAVIFGILTLVLFLVITKGAERVAEVAARFTLDALPGMQLAIEADLRAGASTPRDVSRRRIDLERRSHYYGALDGAMKFVRGDAIAGLVIILVNIGGGVAVGMLRHGLSAASALETYGRLTIGDGLVTMIPALLVSTAAGLLVTRVGQGGHEPRLGQQIATQLTGEPSALIAAAAMALVLAVAPGLPAWPFVVLAAALGAAGAIALWRSRRTPASDGATMGRGRGLRSGATLDLDAVQNLVDRLAEERPVLVRETVPRRIGLAALADQLALLAEDGISSAHLPEVLEAVAREPRDLRPAELDIRIRRRMARTITGELLGAADHLEVVVLDDEVEAVIESGLTTDAIGPQLALPLEITRRVAAACVAAVEGVERPILLVKSHLRRPLGQLLRGSGVPLRVVAHGEVEPGVEIAVKSRIRM